MVNLAQKDVKENIQEEISEKTEFLNNAKNNVAYGESNLIRTVNVLKKALRDLQYKMSEYYVENLSKFSIFKFWGTTSIRSLALRYDLTVPFAKYIASNPNIKLPFKRYEIGKVFRDGPIKKGRAREFVQCDVDSVGIEGQMIEAELISILVEGYSKLGIDIIVKYNNRKLMNGIIEVCKVEKEKISQVITVIDKIEKLSKDELILEFKKQGLQEKQIDDLLKYLNMSLEELSNIFAENNNQNLKEGLAELNELNQYIKELNLTKYVKFVSSLARGQEYYTGTVFEVYTADGSIKSSIGGGGRYDRIIGDFINDGKNILQLE